MPVQPVQPDQPDAGGGPGDRHDGGLGDPPAAVPGHPAAAFWAQALAGWAVPDHLEVASTARGPMRFDVARFARIADHARRINGPSRQRASEVLEAEGAVLDVGCGAGAGSLPLVPPAGQLVGLDLQPDMLAAFAARARALGAEATTIEGRWPDDVARVPEVDVVVCHHVVYGAPELATFAHALAAPARRRVVIELTRRHPLTWLTPFWAALHGIERPTEPSSEDAAAVLAEAGLPVVVEHWAKPRPAGVEDPDEQVRFVRDRLRLGPERDEEIRELLAAHSQPAHREVTTLWWDVG